MVSLIETEALICLLITVGLQVVSSTSTETQEDDRLKEADLIKRIQEGDTGLFDYLVTQYQQRIYYTVIRIVVNHDDANDVVQEAFVKAYKNLDSFKEGYRFYTWLYRIAINSALNFIQHKKQRGESLETMKDEHRFDPKEKKDLEEDYVHSELQGNVREALESIPPDMRSVFTLRVFEDMSYKEIADTMDISIGTVMSRLSRARTMLKSVLLKSGYLQN
ncbi:MAG: sigma-70 family RNA polymerase sigma factor [bacterium]|nr:sigma-70 family RNA polymerase sigma factor [bacterium]